MLERIYVDFNTLAQDLWQRDQRVRLDPQPPERLGTRVVVFDDELEVEAVIEFDPPADGYSGGWWAVPDWSTMRDITALERSRPLQ